MTSRQFKASDQNVRRRIGLGDSEILGHFIHRFIDDTFGLAAHSKDPAQDIGMGRKVGRVA